MNNKIRRERFYAWPLNFPVIDRPMVTSVKPRCREISKNNIEAIGDLLTRGSVRRSREWWMRNARPDRDAKPEDLCQQKLLATANVLENDGVPVG